MRFEPWSNTQASWRRPSSLWKSEVSTRSSPWYPQLWRACRWWTPNGVGRAFPQLQMMTFSVYGGSLCPLAVSDEKGNTVVIPDPLDSTWVERLARALCIQMGCIAAFAMAPMSASQVLNTGVLHTLSLARDLGNSVKRARQRQEDPIDAILEACPGTVLFQGKVVDVDRRTTGGWSQGKVTIAGLGAYDGEHMEIDFPERYMQYRLDA